MNKIFKKVFNARRGKYVAVDETKTGHGQMGTCTVGGHKPAALTSAVVGAVLAMGTSGALAANDLTIGQAQAAEALNYQITDTEVSNLTLSGVGETKKKYSKTFKLEGQACYKSTCITIPLSEYLEASSEKELQDLVDQKIQQAEQGTYPYKVPFLGFTVDLPITGVHVTNPDDEIKSEDIAVDDAPVHATNAATNILKVNGLTNLEKQATLVNEGTITSASGVNIDSTSALVNKGTFSTEIAEGSKTYANVTGEGTISNQGTFTVGAIDAIKVSNAGTLTAGKVAADVFENSGSGTTETNVVGGLDVETTITNSAGLKVNGDVDFGSTTIVTDNTKNQFDNQKDGNLQITGNLNISGSAFDGIEVGGYSIGTYDNSSHVTNSGVISANQLNITHTMGGDLSSFTNEAKTDANGELETNAEFKSVTLSGAELVNNGQMTVEGKTELGSFLGDEYTILGYKVDLPGIGSQFENTGNFETGSLVVDAQSKVQNSGELAVGGDVVVEGETDHAGTINNTGTVTVTGTLDNAGTLTNGSVAKAEGAADPSITLGALNNSSKVENNVGNLTVNGDTTNSAGATLSNKASVDLKGDLDNGGTITNEVVSADDKFAVAGDLTNSGTLTNVQGALTVGGDFANNGLLDNRAQGTITVDGSFTNTHKPTEEAPEVSTNAGTLNVQGDFVNNGTFKNESGATLNVGTDTVESDFFNTGDLTNNGTINVSGDFTSTGGTVTNNATGKFDVEGAFKVDGGDLYNYGTIEAGSITFVENTGNTFVNAGTFIADPSDIDVPVLSGEYHIVNEGIYDGAGKALDVLTITNTGANADMDLGNTTAVSLTNKEHANLFAHGDLTIGTITNDAFMTVVGDVKAENIFTNDANGDADILGNLNVGQLINNGSLDVGGTLDVNGRVQEYTGNLTASSVTNNKHLNVEGNVVAGTLTNNEDADFTIAGSLTGVNKLTNSGLLEVNGGDVAAKDVTNSGEFTVAGSLTGADKLTNSGLLDIVGSVEADKLTNSGQLAVGGSLTSEDELTNSGMLNVTGDVVAGTLTNNAYVPPVNTFGASDDVAYNFTAANLKVTETLDNNGNMLVAGKTDMTGASMNNGGLLNTGSLVVKVDLLSPKDSSVVNTGTLTAGSLEISSLGFGDASFDNQGGTVELGTATISSGSLSNSGNMTIAGGSLSGLVGDVLGLITNADVSGILNGLTDSALEFGLVHSGDVTNTGTLAVNGLSINVNSDLTNQGADSSMTFEDSLISIGGTIVNEGTLTTTGSFDVSSVLGTIDGLGDIVPSEMGQLNVGYVQVDGSITNKKNWTSSGALLFGGNFDNAADATATMDGLMLNVGATITNKGTLETNGALSISGVFGQMADFIPAELDQLSVGYIQVAGGKLNNEGTWDTNSALLMGGSVANSGTVTVDGHLVLMGGSLNNAATGTVTTTGTVFNVDSIVNDGTLNTTGGIEITGVLSSLVPDLTIPGGLTDVAVGLVQVGGSVTNNNDWNSSSIVDVAGTINNNANLTAGHAILVGTKFNNGSAEDKDASATMGGLTLVAGDAVVNNYGTLTTNGAVDLRGFIPAELEAYLPDSLEMVNLGYAQVGGTVNNHGAWDSNSAVMLGGVINNEADATITTEHFVMVGDAQLNNAEGAATNVAGTMVVVGSGDATNVTNDGVMNTTGGIDVGGVIEKIVPELDLPESLTNVDVGYVQLAGDVVNNGQWNASSMVVAGGKFENNEGLNAGHAVVLGDLVNNGSAEMTGTVINAGSVENNGTLNTTGGIEVGSVVESLTNGAVELPAGLNSIDVGYAQIAGTTTNNSEWNASSVVNVAGSIVNNGSFKADHMVSVDGTLTNAADKTVELTGTMVNIATSTDKVVLDNAGSLKTEGSVNLNGLMIGEYELPESMANVELGYAQVGGTANNTGDWDVNNALVVGGVINNANELAADKVFAYGSTITNTGDLKANWIAAAGEGQITNDKLLDADVMGVVGTGFENNAEATIDSMLAINSTVVNDGTLTTVAGVQLPGEVQDGIEQLAEQLGVDISGLDLDQHVELGYTQVGGSMVNNGAWTASNIVAAGGSITNNNTMTTDGIYSVDTDIVNNKKLDINGHLVMVDVNAETAMSNLVNKDEMTVTGAMTLAGVKLTNEGTLTTGDSSIDGAGSVASELINKGTWNSTNLGMLGGSLTNDKELTVEGLMTVAGTYDLEDNLIDYAKVTNNGTLDTTGAIKVEGLELDVGYLQLAGIMTNNKDATWNTDHTALVGGAVVNHGEMNVNGQLMNVHADIVNTGTLNNTAGVAYQDIAANVGYVQALGSMANSGKWTASDIVALGGSITNKGEMSTTGMTLVDTDLTNTAGLKVNGTFTMVEAERGELTNLTNKGDMAVSGAMLLAGVKMENTGNLTTGDGVIDGTGALLSEMTNKGTWNSTNVGMAAGSLVNAGELNVSGLMTVAGGAVANSGNLNTTGAVKVEGLDLDVGYVQAAGSMTNAGTWNTDHTAIVGGSVENRGTMTVNGQLLNVEGDIVNKGTLNNTAGVAFGDLAANVGYLQGKGSMTNSGKWTASDIVALGGTITNEKTGEVTTTGMTMIDTDLTNAGDLMVNGHFAMTEVESGELTKLTNSGDMTVTGAMALAGVKMENTGNLTTGDGVIDGSAALLSEMTNKGTWNSTNVGMAAGRLVNAGDLNVSGLMTVAGGEVANSGNLNTTGAVKVEGLDLDVGYVQAAGSMTNAGTWNTDHTAILAGSVENSGKMTVNGQLLNVEADITNSGTLSTLNGVGFGDIEANVGYVQAMGSMTNSGDWYASQIVALGGSISNIEDGAMFTKDVTLADTDVKNEGVLTVNGHFAMTEVESGELTKLTNSGNMTVTGAMALAGVKMENTGNLTTGDGVIDGSAALLSEMTNKGTWNSTNVSMASGSLANAGEKAVLNVSGLMTVVDGSVTNEGLLTTTGAVHVDGLDLDVGYVQAAGSMTNAGTWVSDHTAILAGSVENSGTMTVNGQLLNGEAALENAGTLNTLKGVGFGEIEANVGYVQAMGSMVNSGTWNSSQIVALGGTITNMESGVMNTLDMTLVDTDVKNVGEMTVDGHFMMTEAALGDYTKLTNTGTMTVTGAMALAGVDMVNTGTLNTGDGSIDGTAALASTMLNTGTWNSTNIGILAGDLNNTGDINVAKQMLIAGGDVNNAGSIKVDSVFGITAGTLNNDGYLVTGDGVIDGAVGVNAELINNGTWDATNLSVALGDLNNAGDINVAKQMFIAGGDIHNAGEINVSEEMVVAGGDVHNAGDINVVKHMVVAGGDVNNVGSIDVDGVFGITAGTLNNNGYLATGDGVIDGAVGVNAEFNNVGTWNASNVSVALGDLNNAGEIHATKNMVVVGGDVNNAVDATITVDGALGITAGSLNNFGHLETGDGVIDGAVGVNAEFNNVGTWNASNVSVALGNLNNAGEIHATKNMVVVGGDVNNIGSIEVDGVFGITAGTLSNHGELTTGDGVIDGTVAAGAALHNDGIWKASNIGVVAGTLTNNDKLTTTGHVTMAGGVITNTSDATMTVGGVLGITAGVLTNNGELKTGDGAIDGAAGALAYLNNNGKWTATNLGIDYGVLTNEGVLKASGTTYVGENGLLANGGEFSAKFLGVEGDFVNNGMTTTGLQLSTSTESSGNFAVAENAHVVNTGLIQSYGSVGVAGTVDLLSGAWTVQADANKGDVFFNDGSITGNGMLNLIGGVAVNTKDSTFDVGTLNLVDNATLYHGAESDSDFSGRLAGLYTDEALAKLKELAGIDVTTTTVKIDDAEVAVKVLSNTHSKNQLVVGKTLNVTNLNVGNSAMTLATNDKATFAQGSSTIIDVDSLGKDYAFESNGSELVVEDKAALVLQGVTHGGRYNVAQGFDLTDFGSSSGWQGNYLYAPEISGTGLKWVLDLDWGNGNVWVGAELESVGERHNVIHKNIIDNALRYVADNMTYSLRATPSATDMGFTRKIYRDLWMNFDVTRDMKVLVSNSLASIAQNVAVESLALDNVTDVVKSIEERVSFAGDVFRADGTMNELVADTHLWAHVLGSDRKQNGLNGAGGAVSIGYEAEDYGLIVGFDAANADKTARFGMAMSYIDGNATSNGSLLATSADYSTFGLHGYMNFTPNDKFNLIATVGFGRNSADAKMNLPQLAGWNYGQATADVDTTVFSTALRAETRFAFNNINVIPHAGLRMMMVDAGSYDTKVDGQTAFNNDVKMALIGQTPFGVTVKGQFEQSGWNVKPMADITFVTQFGDTESRTTTTVPGISVSDTYAAEFAGNFATTMSVGVEAEKGNCNVGLQLGVTKGQNDKTDTNFMAKVRYQF